MLSKPKKLFTALLSSALSLQLLVSPCIVASAESGNYTEKAVLDSSSSNISESASNGGSVIDALTDQDAVNGILTLIETFAKQEEILKKAVDWGAKKFMAEALNIKSDDEKLMEKIDKLMEGQDKLHNEIQSLSRQITCTQLNGIINDYNKIKDSMSPYIIFNSLREIDENKSYSSEKAQALRIDALTKELGIYDDDMGKIDSNFDKYYNSLKNILTIELEVTYEDGVTKSDDLFEVKYQSLRRKYHWEHQAYSEWITFQNDALLTYTITATIEKRSLQARIYNIEKWNSTHSESEQKHSGYVSNKLKQVNEDIKKIQKLVDRKVVVRDESERYYWTPGHEILLYTTPNTQGIPQENKNAGVGDNKYIKRAKGIKLVKNYSDCYVPTTRFNFWKPFIRYEGGDTLLANYDQLNMILKDYGGKKSLYDIFFSKDEGNFNLPSKVNQDCRFVIDAQKSEVTGKSYPLTYEPYFFKADQVYCYGIENSKIQGDKLPSPSKIHLCYYHNSHADPKKDDNCVGIGVKSVGEIPPNDNKSVKEETYTNCNETIVWSEDMQDLHFPISENAGNVISVSADGNVIDKDKYSVSEDKTQITLSKEFLLTLESGTHTLAVESGNAINSFSFTVAYKSTTSEPDNSVSDEKPSSSTDTNIDAPKTGDSNSWVYMAVLTSAMGLIIFINIKANKKNKMTKM